MTQFEGFGETPANCAVCEAMLPEAVDGTLTADEQRAFDTHVASCTHCAQELAEARRGAAWLSMLKSKTPEPPVGLLERILAETSGVAVPQAVAPEEFATPLMRDEAAHEWGTQGAAKAQGGWNRRWSETRVKLGEMFSLGNAAMLLQPRLAMTAAMAFFSLALTLNLMGVRVHDLRVADFTPSGIRRNLADAGASATRQFENMRVVYQMESRMNELNGNGQQ
ncbi:zf-HC2 domain-containing protein [Granulicella sp. 5B5]|uniref:anti-sigma factor family protein n=1 Tax=Granulicella sp. 5B5 TaxID=1617967 RepID=UPI00210581E2|nr:zf-HC2 domain-containing protein [Granulicella sp. 5B5]